MTDTAAGAAAKLATWGIEATLDVPVGFGCGSLHAKWREESAAALRAALEEGVAYFDTARMYGEGTAEAILGEVLAGRRKSVILASKAGILPSSRSLGRKVADKVRSLAQRAPGLASLVAAPAPALPTFFQFAPASLRESVETSLRALRTDHLDILLLHECRVEDALSQDVRAVANELVAAGKVRQVGTATHVPESVAILQTSPFGGIVQIPRSAFQGDVEDLPPAYDALVITHSALAADYARFLDAMRRSTAMREGFETRTGVDPLGPRLPLLLLQLVRAGNPDGLTLFSSRKPDRVRANVAAMRDAAVDQAAVAAVRDELGRMRQTSA